MKEKSNKLKDTPTYYKAGEHDLYDSFILHYGLETWKRHVEMEVIQYILRAPRKGSYAQDIQKAIVILERILKEIEEAKK